MCQCSIYNSLTWFQNWKLPSKLTFWRHRLNWKPIPWYVSLWFRIVSSWLYFQHQRATHKHAHEHMAYDAQYISDSSSGSHRSVHGLFTRRRCKLWGWGKMGSLQDHSLMLEQCFLCSIIGPSPTLTPHLSLQTSCIGMQLYYTCSLRLLQEHHTRTHHSHQNQQATFLTMGMYCCVTLYWQSARGEVVYSIRLSALFPQFPLIIQPAGASRVISMSLNITHVLKNCIQLHWF